MNYTQALALKANNSQVTVADIKSMLMNLKGVTMAGLTTVTEVKTAAAHRDRNILKVTEASVQLFNELTDKDVYGRAVKRNASQDSRNDPADVANQKTQENYYEHDADCHSIVYHRTTGKPYLYAFYNSGKSTYLIDGQPSTREQVASYLTGSDARKLLEPTDAFNVTDNLFTGVTVRVLKLESIVELRAMKQTLTV